MFVSNSVLQKEKDHITDFAPEVAWATKSNWPTHHYQTDLRDR